MKTKMERLADVAGDVTVSEMDRDNARTLMVMEKQKEIKKENSNDLPAMQRQLQPGD